jgi:RND family efflux transporter MFP subunit
MFLVSDLGKLWAIAEVQEEFLGKLRVGMPVRVFVQAYPQTPFAGRIGKLGETLDPATRTVKVRVDIPNPDGRLKPEMYANTEIEIGRTDPVVVVPAEAIQDARGQAVVFVQVAEDQFEARPVVTGRTLDGATEVLSGVQPGERIAVRATFILKSEFLKAALAQE